MLFLAFSTRCRCLVLVRVLVCVACCVADPGHVGMLWAVGPTLLSTVCHTSQPTLSSVAQHVCCAALCCVCSAKVCGRRPLALDPTLNYEVDSDEEWEEEPEGESLSVSGGCRVMGEEEGGGGHRCCGGKGGVWAAPGRVQ